MSPNAPLAGQTLLLTGTGSGIGRAAALAAAAAGAHVVATDIKGHDTTAAEIAAAAGSATAHLLDVTEAAAWAEVVGATLAARGRIDGLGNIAGSLSSRDSLLTQDRAGWDRLLEVDLTGPFLGMQAVVPHMLDAGRGKIVNVASVAGMIGMPNVMAYAAAKGGVIAMSRQIAVEFAARNLRVNVVAPGVTRTAMLGDVTPELYAAVTAATPTERIGEPEDIARMITYLFGPGSDFITGQVFVVDGGWTAQ